jgi:hypothetical protein
MSKPRAAGPHHPDVLLNLVGRRLQAACAKEGWKLGAMTVCVDGGLRLFLVPIDGPPGQGIELLWERETLSGSEVAGFGGGVVARPGNNPPSEEIQVMLARLAATTFASLPPSQFELLNFAKGSKRTIVFNKQITSQLFGGWLAEGKTGWRGYLCRTMTQSFAPAVLMIEFAKMSGTVTVELLPRLEGSSSHYRPGTTRFNIVVRNEAGDEVGTRPGTPGAFVGFLVSRRLEPRCRIVPDPEQVVQEEAQTGGGRPAPWEWGKERGWRRFFHMEEVMELAEVRRTLHGPHAEVVLGERECHNAHPCSYGPRMEVYDFPALAPWPDLYSGKLLASMVSERDLITGPGQLFQQMLDAASAVPGCRAVVVADSCVSSLLAEDADQLSSTVEGDGATAATESGENMFLRNDHFYRGLLSKARKERSPMDGAGAVNLVGYLPGPARDELISLLEQCGVRVNGCFLPDIHLAELDDFHRAECNILYPISHRESAHAAIEHASGLPAVLPPAPFGLAGATNWLVHVAGIFGREQRGLELSREWQARHRDELEMVRRQIAETVVAFVLSEVDSGFLLEPSSAMGVPLLAVLEEWGFSIEVIYYERDAGREDCKHLGSRLPAATFITFADECELATVLAASEARLIFSDSRCDSRVHGAGKNTFSLRHFEMGFEGALQTARGLARRAANPYFARFAPVQKPEQEEA